ncbi:transposase [Pseudoalteromonas sp. BSi20652]|nr:transposase [Pseudoalteromonas sp. BSi20652]
MYRQFGRQKLWQKGFYDHLIRNTEDLNSCARYIVANPLRANLIENIAEYPYWDSIYLNS